MSAAVSVLARVPSLHVVGGAWVSLRVALRCECGAKHVAESRQWGAAEGAPECDHERVDLAVRAAHDHPVPPPAAGWGYTRCGVPCAPPCRRRSDCGRPFNTFGPAHA